MAQGGVGSPNPGRMGTPRGLLHPPKPTRLNVTHGQANTLLGGQGAHTYPNRHRTRTMGTTHPNNNNNNTNNKHLPTCPLTGVMLHCHHQSPSIMHSQGIECHYTRRLRNTRINWKLGVGILYKCTIKIV